VEKARADRLGAELEEREDELRERERTAENRAREEARRLLLEARQEVETAIREVRAVAEGTPEPATLEEATRQARRRVEAAAQRHLQPERPGRSGGTQRDFQPGDRVALVGSGAEGRVVELREDRVMVETAGIRMQVPAQDLVFRGRTPEGETSTRRSGGVQASAWQGPEAQPESEVDLRGMRVADVGPALDRALDQGVLGGLGELRIIHGKGTGALRERVSELLAQDPRVREFRMGLPGEGGGGVTVVKIK